jgi:hypothetical protein
MRERNTDSRRDEDISPGYHQWNFFLKILGSKLENMTVSFFKVYKSRKMMSNN